MLKWEKRKKELKNEVFKTTIDDSYFLVYRGVLHAVIPIQMPASIYGLVLLFIALMTGLVKLPQVHEAARFLIEIMPLMFIPAGVGLIDSWGELRPILLPVIVLLLVSTVLVMGVSGQVTQQMMHHGKKEDKNE